MYDAVTSAPYSKKKKSSGSIGRRKKRSSTQLSKHQSVAVADYNIVSWSSKKYPNKSASFIIQI